LNKKQHAIYDDYMYKKILYPNQPIHLLLIGGIGASITFTLLLLIQGLLKHYNKQLCSNPWKQKIILIAYISKAAFNIDGITIHFGLNPPLNCKHL